MGGIQIVIMNKLLFWTAVILCVISVHNMFLSRKIDSVRRRELTIPDRAYWILIGIGFAVAIFVRAYRFGIVPGGMNQDGAMAAVDAKALADYGTDRYGMRFPVHLTAWKYGQMSCLLSYLMVPFIKLFGFSVTTVRLPQLFISLAGLVCLFLFVKDVFGKNCALFIGLFAAINPWHIMQSRWALDCNLFPHFLIFGMYFLNRAAMGKRRTANLILSMIAFGLCMYCYGVALYTVPLLLLAACIWLLVTKRIRFREALLALAVWLLVSWPFLLTMMVNFFHWETIETPFFTIPYFAESIRANDIVFFSDHILKQFFENALTLTRVVVMQEKDLPWNDMEKFGSMYLFSMPFAVVGFISLCRSLKDKAGAGLILFFLMAGVWCGVATNQTNINRVNCIFYPVIILIGLGIYEAAGWCAIPKLSFGVAAAFLVMFLLFSRNYFTSYADQMTGQFNKDFGDAVSSLKDDKQEKFYITTDGFGGLSMNSEILTLFWLGIDAEYYQEIRTPEGELPYSQKFIYTRMCDLVPDAAESALYVVTADELQYFDSELFAFEDFGAYYVVTAQEN